MRFTRLLRSGTPLGALVLALGITTGLYAQSINLSFDSTINFPTFPPYPYSSEYVQCMEPVERQREDSLVQLQIIYEQNKVMFVRLRGDARIEAWRIPERSARSRALRDSDRAYRDAVRELDRWYRDQERAIRRQFVDAEDTCDNQFDNDVDSPDDGSSSSFSSSRSSSSSFGSGPVCGNGICEVNEGVICPPCDAFPCTQSCMIGTCPQDCGITSSSSSRSSSSSSRSSSSSSRSSSSSFVSCFGSDMCIPQQNCAAIGGSITPPGSCGTPHQIQSGYACCRVNSSSLSSSSSRSSSSFASCTGGDMCIPTTTCASFGGQITSPVTCAPSGGANATYYCCRLPSSSSSRSSSSFMFFSSSSSWIFYPQEAQQQGIQSCACETVCDPSGSPCMAVCPNEC
jgi:hypothetical protein